jgi:hypothetical protein
VRVEFSAFVEGDLIAIADYIAQDNQRILPDAANLVAYFLNKLNSALWIRDSLSHPSQSCED